MREELTHLIKGEFIFFVRPGIEEDMRPLKLSDRDILPGGLTRQEYDPIMNRLKRESTIAIEESRAGKHVPMEWRQKWFEDSLPEIEKDVNFAFKELPLLYRDGRSLEYMVDKNQDDELLQEIHDTLLRRIITMDASNTLLSLTSYLKLRYHSHAPLHTTNFQYYGIKLALAIEC